MFKRILGYLATMLLFTFSMLAQPPEKVQLIKPIVENTGLSEYDAYQNSDFLNWGVERANLRELITEYNGEGIKVCICDTGTPNHGKLKASFAGDSNFTQEVSKEDFNGHSTHVAGIIHEVQPRAKLYYAKVLEADGTGYTSVLADAVLWCASRGADFINMSIGTSYADPNLLKALQAFQEQGGLTFAAVGNSGQPVDHNGNIGYPAKWELVIGVGSHDISDQASYFTSWGHEGFLSAAGSNIKSTYLNQTYSTLSGTSMATPFALSMASIYKQKEGSLGEYRKHVLERAVDIDEQGFDERTFNGMLTDNFYYQSDLPDKEDDEVENGEPLAGGSPVKWWVMAGLVVTAVVAYLVSTAK